MRTLKTIGYEIGIKFKSCPHVFRSGPDFNTENTAKEMAEKMALLPDIEEVNVAVNIKELVVSIEGEPNKEDDRKQAGFTAPE